MKPAKLKRAHATFGSLMAGRRYEDVSPAALAYERGHGELLKQIAPNKGGRPSETQEATHPSYSRTQAATDAGMSERQRKTVRGAGDRIPTAFMPGRNGTPQRSNEHEILLCARARARG